MEVITDKLKTVEQLCLKWVSFFYRQTLAENEIEENWDDDWEEENDSEISQIITDPSAPTMIEKAIAETPLEIASEEEKEEDHEEESPEISETEEPIDQSSQTSYKFSLYVEETIEVANLEEKALFEESPEETPSESETPRSPLDSSDSSEKWV